jgi:hypothetical protein
MNLSINAHAIITEHNIISDNQHVISAFETSDDTILEKINSQNKFCLLVLCSMCDSEENFTNILFMYGKDNFDDKYKFINRIDANLLAIDKMPYYIKS